MNSTESLLVNGMSRRSVLKALSLSILVPSVSSAVETVTARDSREHTRKHKKEAGEKEVVQSSESNVGKTALIVTTLLGLDVEARNAICHAIDDFFETYIINPLSEEYSDTIVGTMKMIGPIFVLAMISHFFSVKSGNAGQEHHETEMKTLGVVPSFWSDIWGGSVEAPLIEEGIFRMFTPFVLKKIFNQEVAQYYSSLVFGFAHNLNAKGSFDSATFPTPLILSGFFLFYLKESRDVSHSIVSHSFHNALAISIAHIRKRLK